MQAVQEPGARPRQGCYRWLRLAGSRAPDRSARARGRTPCTEKGRRPVNPDSSGRWPGSLSFGHLLAAGASVMSSLITHVASQQDYRKALKTWRPVVFYFGHPHCYACGWADPLFCNVAETFQDRAVIYKLSTHESPRHPEVTGTPTILFYKDGKLRRKLKGINDEQSLVRAFTEHVGRTRPRHVPCPRRRYLRRLQTLCTVKRGGELTRRRAILRSRFSKDGLLATIAGMKKNTYRLAASS